MLTKKADRKELNIPENIWLYLVFLILLIIPFQLKIIRLPLVLLPLLSFLVFLKRKEFHFRWILFLPMLFLIVEFLWIFIDQENIRARIFKLDSQLALFFVPLSFMFVRPELIRQNSIKLFEVFIIGNVLNALFALGYSFFHVLDNQNPLTAAHLDLYLSQLHHHTYFSLNALLAMLLIMHLLFRRKVAKWNIALLVFGWLVLTLAIFVAASRIGLFLGMVLNIVFVWHLLGKIKPGWVRYAAVPLVIGGFSLLVVNSSGFSYLKTNDTDKSIIERLLTKNRNNSIRKVIWDKSFAIGREAFPLGNGTGTFKSIMADELSEEYKQRLITMPEPDAHNQYLETFFETGIAGIAAILALIFVPLYFGFKNRNYLLMEMMLIFLIMFFFESLLKRQWGVESFVFLYVMLSIPYRTRF